MREFEKVTCGNCLWEKPSPPDTRWFDRRDNRGRPKRERPLGLTPYDIQSSDDDAPEWFKEAMMLHEQWITVPEFAKRFGCHVTQIRRWCDAGLIHCAWTDHIYRKRVFDPGIRELEGLRGKPSNGNILWKRYVYHKPVGKGSQRCIPPSEVERCHFLKLKMHKRSAKTVEKPPIWREKLAGEIDLSVFEE